MQQLHMHAACSMFAYPVESINLVAVGITSRHAKHASWRRGACQHLARHAYRIARVLQRRQPGHVDQPAVGMHHAERQYMLLQACGSSCPHQVLLQAACTLARSRPDGSSCTPGTHVAASASRPRGKTRPRVSFMTMLSRLWRAAGKFSSPGALAISTV